LGETANWYVQVRKYRENGLSPEKKLDTVNQLPLIDPFIEDGRIHLDNNVNENKIRPLALRRKNFLFASSYEGAKRIATMYFFFASCNFHKISI
jgi:transposase